MTKLHKLYCEIDDCPETNPHALEHHHIVHRTEINTSNSPWNLAVICANCHAKNHSGDIKIIGVFPSSNKQGRILIYLKNGKCNVPGMETAQPYFKHKPQQMKLPGDR